MQVACHSRGARVSPPRRVKPLHPPTIRIRRRQPLWSDSPASHRTSMTEEVTLPDRKESILLGVNPDDPYRSGPPRVLRCGSSKIVLGGGPGTGRRRRSVIVGVSPGAGGTETPAIRVGFHRLCPRWSVVAGAPLPSLTLLAEARATGAGNRAAVARRHRERWPGCHRRRWRPSKAVPIYRGRL